jgi:hypothetical protein
MPEDPAGTPPDGRSVDLPSSDEIARLLRLVSMMQSLHSEAESVELDHDASARQRLAEVQSRALEAITTSVSHDVG